MFRNNTTLFELTLGTDAKAVLRKIDTVEDLNMYLRNVYKNRTFDVITKIHHFLKCKKFGYPIYFIDSLYVHEQARGRGLATILLNNSENYLFSITPCIFLVCDTVNEDIPLIPFYEKRGYKKIPTGLRKYPLMFKTIY